MGLDISAYSRLSDPRPLGEDDECGANETRFYINDAFPGRAGDIKEKTAYQFGESFGFRAGSYSGYNAWRSMLARMVGDDGESETGPFVELINFSDCEGVIAGPAAVKLAKDFADHDDKAKNGLGDEHEWFYAKYKEWRKAFDLAADGGAVSFH